VCPSASSIPAKLIDLHSREHPQGIEQATHLAIPPVPPNAYACPLTGGVATEVRVWLMSACFDNRNSDDAHPLPVRCENAAVGPVASATHISESCVNSIPKPARANDAVLQYRTRGARSGQEQAMDYQDRIRAFHALHAYESLEDLENDGDEDAVRLREKLFDQFIEAWEELRPAVVGEY